MLLTPRHQPFRKNRKRHITLPFLTGSNALGPSNQHEKKNGPRNKHFSVKNLDPRVVSKTRIK